jgi:hypothetical protein
MAERLSGREWPAQERYGKYPWKEWLDGGTWQLTPGEDFTTAMEVFRRAAHAAAQARHGKVRTAVRNGHFLLQFLPGDKS